MAEQQGVPDTRIKDLTKAVSKNSDMINTLTNNQVKIMELTNRILELVTKGGDDDVKQS